MKQLKVVYIVLVIMAINNFANAQKRNLDSLYKLINTTTNKKIIVENLIHVWWWYYQEQQHQKSLEVLNNAKSIATIAADSGLMFKATGNLGFHYKYLKNYGAAVFYFKEAERLIPNDEKKKSRKLGIFNNLSECYDLIGKYDKQLSCIDSCIKINYVLKDTLDGFYICASLAKYYYSTKNYQLMLSIIDSALHKMNVPYWEKIAVGVDRMNYIFNLYNKENENKTKWLNVSTTYFNDYNKLFEERGSNLTQLELNRDWILRAKYYLLHNDYKAAEQYISKLELANKNIFSPEFNVPYLKLKFYINNKKGNSSASKEIFDKLEIISDSIQLSLHKNHAESIEEVLNGEDELQKEKIEKNEKIVLANQSKKNSRLIILFSSTLLLLLSVGIFLLRGRFIKEKKQKHIISKQKELVDEKQKEITDSINYAKRIQNAMLAPEKFLNEKLKNYFIYFNPKDIVSGDFYWASNISNYFFIAICDSTGHGIPGSFMSLINISYLNEAINEKHILEPNLVFDYVRKRLIETLSSEGQKDGFDGILLRINLNTNELIYSAANNAPVLVKNNIAIELPKDRMPVGKGEKENNFEAHKLLLQPGDMIYAFTDGYADQFGGEGGKKYKKNNLIELLKNNQGLNMNEQKEYLAKTFNNWKGGLEQVDDVCVFGLKIE